MSVCLSLSLLLYSYLIISPSLSLSLSLCYIPISLSLHHSIPISLSFYLAQIISLSLSILLSLALFWTPILLFLLSTLPPHPHPNPTPPHSYPLSTKNESLHAFFLFSTLFSLAESAPSNRRSSERPSMSSGCGTPAMSRKVGARSMLSAILLTLEYQKVNVVNPGISKGQCC